MIKKQNKNRLFNREFSKHLIRRQIIGVILKICKNMKYNYSIFFSAIALFDSVISRFNLDKKNLYKIAIASLILMVKLKQNKSFQIPKKDLLKSSGLLFYQKNSYPEIEKFVLCSNLFDINILIPFDFIDFFMFYLSIIKKKKELYFKNKKTKFIFRKLLVKLHIQLIKEYNFNQYTPLALAITSLMIIRKRLKLYPLIPLIIKKLTGCDEKIFNSLFKKIKAKFFDL